MYDKVVVPLDGSENSEKVLPYIEALSQKTDCELIFLGICSDHERSFEYLFKKYIQDLAVQYQNKGFKAESFFLYGNPFEEINRYVEENKASMIAMATHGRSGFKEWMLGGTSEKILLHSSKPVLLVPPGQRCETSAKRVEWQNILVPLDGSDRGASALSWAKELARVGNARLILLQVILSTDKIVGVMNYAARFEKQLAETLRSHAREYLASLAAELEKEKLDVKTELAEGIPSEKILEYARNNKIDLIAISKHGLTGARQAVLGSVAHQVIHGSEIPVLVIPPH